MKNRKMRSEQKEDRAQDNQPGQPQDGEPATNAQEKTSEDEHHGRGRRGRGRGHHGGRGGGRHGRRGGGRRGRAKRGEARYILLDALRDGPKHGYEMIKTLEERSAGQYIPSPGTVYPTLQYLEDRGLVRAKQDAERRVYQLTEAGKAELDEQAEPITAFWSQFAAQSAPAASQPEIRFLEEELEHLNRIVWSGLRDAVAEGDQATIRGVRQAVEACQTQVREVIASTSRHK